METLRDPVLRLLTIIIVFAFRAKKESVASRVSECLRTTLSGCLELHTDGNCHTKNWKGKTQQSNETIGFVILSLEKRPIVDNFYTPLAQEGDNS